MEEHTIRFIERTFGELEKGIAPNVRDPYNIMASLGSKMREAVLHNPSGYREDEVCQILALDGDVVVGATNPFSGRLLINGDVVWCQNGSYLFAHENYRKYNVGGELLYRILNLHETKNSFAVGMSQMVIPLYRVLKTIVFEFPRLIYLRKSRCVIQSILKTDSLIIKPIILLSDLALWIHRLFVTIHNAIHYKDYSIEEVKDCSDEIVQIVREDKHPYMELHDKAWFDWSLKYSISEDERTLRRLYVIRHRGIVEGFFFIKQEFFEQASSRGFKNVYLGSVMEWGLKNQSKLKEKDIVLLSLNCFDSDVDGIQYASTDQITCKSLKRWLFVRVGNANTGVRIRSIKDKSFSDINNWRLRLGGDDTMLN